MKRFILKFLLYSIVPVLFIAVILIVDVYNVTNRRNYPGPKKEIAYLPDQGRRQELLAFTNHPTSNIILGDSRTYNIGVEELGSNWSQLSFNGGDLMEAIDAFWYATSKTKVDTVLFGCDPFLYTKAIRRTIIPTKIENEIKLIDKKISFLLDYKTIKATFNYVIKSIFSNYNVDKNTPDMDRNAFWESQLQLARDCQEPQIINREEYVKLLNEVNDYCRDNNITMIITCPPIHIELQDIFKEFKEGIYTEDVLNIFDLVYDFSYENSYTVNKDNFGDPFHCVDNSLYIQVLKKHDFSYCKVE